jgi:ribosomal protein S18 acetylase RimI-like enzyme
VSPKVDIRPASRADVAAVVRVHVAAFPGFYLSDLGPAFLRAYYRLILGHRGGCILVAEAEETVAGFVAGFRDPSAFYRGMAAAKWRLAWPIARGLLRNPRLIVRTVHNVYRVRSAQHQPPLASGDCCELSSLAVAPEYAKNGIGSRLVARFVAENRAAGVAKISLATDAEDNDSVNRFYQRLGFKNEGIYQAVGGRWMHEYVLWLDGHPVDRDGRLLGQGQQA